MPLDETIGVAHKHEHTYTCHIFRRVSVYRPDPPGPVGISSIIIGWKAVKEEEQMRHADGEPGIRNGIIQKVQ